MSGWGFVEGPYPVVFAAIFDDRRLQRRFDAGNLGQIDIALDLLVLGGPEIKLLDAVSLGDGDPGLFPVPRVDQHARGHYYHSRRAAARQTKRPQAPGTDGGGR